MTFEIDDGVAIVTINRPEARNALDDAVRRDFDRAITRIEDGVGRTIHAAVLTGAVHGRSRHGNRRVYRSVG